MFVQSKIARSGGAGRSAVSVVYRAVCVRMQFSHAHTVRYPRQSLSCSTEEVGSPSPLTHARELDGRNEATFAFAFIVLAHRRLHSRLGWIAQYGTCMIMGIKRSRHFTY